jgi:CheY-like chemotaxis protein
MRQLILIVEDNPLNSELLRDWLEVEGYEVSTAANLNTAFSLLEARQPNAVLLDVQLGDDDGLSLVCSIRHRPEMRHIPVIAVTAQAMVAERRRILDSGCNGIVSKPIDFAVLQEQLRLCLNQTRGSGEAS